MVTTLFQLSTDDALMGEDGPLTLRSPRLELVTARSSDSGMVLPPALPAGSPPSWEGDASPDDRSGIVLAAHRHTSPDSIEWLDDSDLLVELDEEPLFLDDDDDDADTERTSPPDACVEDTEPPPPTLRSARWKVADPVLAQKADEQRAQAGARGEGDEEPDRVASLLGGGGLGAGLPAGDGDGEFQVPDAA